MSSLADARGTRGKRVLIAVIGSLGDLYPHIAVALDLQSRGYRPIVATLASQTGHVTGAGLECFALSEKSLPAHKEIVARGIDPRNGETYNIGEVLLPLARDTYPALKAAAQADGGACLLITPQTVLAASFLVEELRIPWIQTCVVPSALDFIPRADLTRQNWANARRIVRWLRSRARRVVRRNPGEAEPRTNSLRRELGLAPARATSPAIPDLTLAMFSPEICRATASWPARVRQTGCAFYDGRETAGELPAALEAFLRVGPPPVIFTLGSAVNQVGADFFRISVAAAREAGVRALLLTGKGAGLQVDRPKSSEQDIAIFEQVPYSMIFPRAAAVVHQGGIGTTTLALRAGLRMLVVPFGFDQPDTAARIARLGAGLVINQADYTTPRVAEALRQILADEKIKQRCAAIAQRLEKENGAEVAGELITSYLQTKPS